MQYSFTCPACGHTVTVDAQNADEAVEKLMEAGKGHAATDHPGGPMMPDDQMKEQVRSGMVQGEAGVQPGSVGTTSPVPQTPTDTDNSGENNSGGQQGSGV